MSASVKVGAEVLSAAAPAVIVPLTSVAADDLVAEVRGAVEAGADIVEWRADHWLACHGAGSDGPGLTEVLTQLRQAAGAVPVLFTVRTTAEGGAGPEGDQYTQLLESVIRAHSADLVDIEYRRDGAQALFTLAREHDVPVVASYHDFHSTPPAEEIMAILREQEDMGAGVAKVAVMPQTAADVATLMLATARHTERAGIPVITMSMAGLGAVSRISGHVFGSAASFGSVGRASAPGQIPVEDLKSLLDGVNRATAGS
ncbi:MULTISPECIES: type I 3-dehydroquinate dehydratase [Kocuria]|uniref:3-dehydroquinate dehydratase n=1 Tax=Kocuria subflava TaxID=1736139 RepID=A0A846U2N6_9MICC|nr:type I 3-dehydroquinate dehydratase [Kocuria sp. CPCC 104605]NKE08971.1 type I 3-dehydroquinate dehydratase [Kocuria subflava]